MEHDKPHLQESWTPGRCNETTGFLFRHECGEMPLRQCVQCGKPLCEKHAFEGVDGTLCTRCFKQQPKSPNAMTPNDMTPNQTSPGGNEPYFSGDQYYRGYGHYGPGFWGYAWLASHGTHHHHRHHHQHRQHDPNDFTEADAESLTNLGDEDFESDMSES